jgi:hypothetical protein
MRSRIVVAACVKSLLSIGVAGLLSFYSSSSASADSITVSPGPFDYGNVPVTTTSAISSFRVTISYTSGFPFVGFSAVTLGDPPPNPFSVTIDPTSPDSSSTILSSLYDVTFKPSSALFYSGIFEAVFFTSPSRPPGSCSDAPD